MDALAVVTVESDTIKVYQSTDKSKLEEIVARAKASNIPYAVLATYDDTTV